MESCSTSWTLAKLDWNYDSKLKAMTYRYLGAADHQWLLWKGKLETHVNHLNFKRIFFYTWKQYPWDDLNLCTSLSMICDFALYVVDSFITSIYISAWYKTKSCRDRIDMMNMTVNIKMIALFTRYISVVY